MPVKTFSATLERRTRNSLNWTIIWIPFDVAKLWGSRGHLRVKGQINGFQFRTALLPTRARRHFMIVNKHMQKGAKVSPGMEARFQIEADTEKRAVPAAPELEKLVRSSRQLHKFYRSLSPSTRVDMSRFVAAAKQPATRLRRAERMAERLMETMEAESELPPLIRQALARDQRALDAWNRMSSSHRRRHLLGIFYYQDPRSRLRRIEKAVEELLAGTNDSGD
jgi:uncharacterized protein YdeI (YjbR/CyaY-like superfamily)